MITLLLILGIATHEIDCVIEQQTYATSTIENMNSAGFVPYGSENAITIPLRACHGAGSAQIELWQPVCEETFQIASSEGEILDTVHVTGKCDENGLVDADGIHTLEIL